MLHHLDYEYTDKEISPWGGLRFIQELHERCGLKKRIEDLALPHPGSKKRADAENQIKELKYNYGMEGFCSESFSATEAAFRWVMVAYNLMSLFKQKTVTTKSIPTLSTLRFQCIAIGSYIITKGRKEVLKLSIKESKRDFFDTLFKKLNSISYATG
jgi:hypothetical protein